MLSLIEGPMLEIGVGHPLLYMPKIQMFHTRVFRKNPGTQDGRFEI